MRRLVLASALLLASVGFSSVVSADSERNFGSAMCGQPMACSAFDAGTASSTLVAEATRCVASEFGMNRNAEIFEDNGLDGDRCLTTKPFKKSSTSLTMTPHCCVISVDNGNCQLQCNQIGIR